jgi:hypothetical protein
MWEPRNTVTLCPVTLCPIGSSNRSKFQAYVTYLVLITSMCRQWNTFIIIILYLQYNINLMNSQHHKRWKKNALLTWKQGNSFIPNTLHTYHSASQWLLAGGVNIATTRDFVPDFVIICAKFRMLHCTPCYNLPHVPLLSDITIEATGNLTENSSSVRNMLLCKTFYNCPNVLWNPVFELHVSVSVPPSLSPSFTMTNASRPVLVKLHVN